MNELWIIAGFFVFVLAAVSAGGYFVLSRNAPSEAGGAPSAIVVPDVTLNGFGALVQLFQFVGRSIPQAGDADNPLRARLLQAGYRMGSAVQIFYGIKCASALAFAILFFWAATAMEVNPLLPMGCSAAFGYLLPDRVLHGVARARGRRLRRALPSAMDMLVLAVEAGQSIDQAMAAASRGLKNTYPDLAAELTTLQLEARASNNRVEALRSFATRTREPEIKKFASLLIDTDRFGTSIGPALRDHAKYLRIRFRQEAQTAARKVGVKLIFPVFFLIFPSVLLVTLGPAVILIFTQLKRMVGN